MATPQLDSRVIELATELDDYLDDISGDKQTALWEVSALFDSMEWKRIREMALGILREMDA